MSLNEILKNFFDMICIKMDPKPQPWGVWHLSFLIIGIGLICYTVSVNFGLAAVPPDDD